MINRPISMTETLLAGSIEGFLDSDEIKTLAAIMDEFFQSAGKSAFDKQRTCSIHEVPGIDSRAVRISYEPAGRIEVTMIPSEAEVLLQSAFCRAIPAIHRLFPSAAVCRPWTYVEYGVGQHITSHLDGIALDPTSWPRQIAGISVLIQKANAGGEFYIETTSAGALWSRVAPSGSGYADEMQLAHEGADETSSWFRAIPKTRWIVDPPESTALLYGSQLIHGTQPVRAGRACKFISWLVLQH